MTDGAACEVCAALPDRTERAARTLPDLFDRLRVVSREPTEWRTVFECAICRTVWLEEHVLTGRYETPCLERQREP